MAASFVRPSQVIAILLSFLTGCAATDNARTSAQRYAHAIATNDLDTVIAMTDPFLMEKVGDVSAFRAAVAQVLDPSTTAAPILGEEIRSISPGFTDSVGQHFFVETTRTNRQPDGSVMHMDNFYVLTSRDFGGSWKVLDLACADEQWVRAVAPGWSGFPTLPQQRVRFTEVNAIIQKYAPVYP